jgi:hypothetical protein
MGFQILLALFAHKTMNAEVKTQHQHQHADRG